MAYGGSFSVPFLFDDTPSIVENETIRHLWPPWQALATPSANVTTQGRPVLNYTFALNYALSGSAVWSYHAVNLAIHLAAGVILFGVLRRTFRGIQIEGSGGSNHTPTLLAAAIALLWTVHPLQTEAVTYVVQRAESLMGFFYLLTLYGFIRMSEAESGRAQIQWATASVFSCYLGAATKEVMVSAPLIILAYDRTFVAKTFAAAWARRWRYYVVLAGSWIVVGLCLARGGGTRGGAIGFGIGISWWNHGLTQFEAIGRYILLSVWPDPLVFEYGAFQITRAMAVLPWAALVVSAIAGTVWGVWRRPALGFAGLWFFALLAPTSLVPGTSQMIVEHRMYLSLAAVLTLAVYGGYSLHVLVAKRWFARPSPIASAAAPVTAVICIAMAFGLFTAGRNAVYRDPVVLWRDTIAKRPENPLAHYMLAESLVAEHKWADARQAFERAIEVYPGFVVARERLGELLLRLGELDQAAAHFEAALALRPDLADAHSNLGTVLAQRGRLPDALIHLNRAVAIVPTYAEAYGNRGIVYMQMGQPEKALSDFRESVRLAPDRAAAHCRLANALAELGHNNEALAEYAATLRLQPDFPAAEYNLANTFAALQRHEDAVVHYRRALQLHPDNPAAELNLGNSLAALRQYREAAIHYASVVRREPDNVAAEANLGSALLESGDAAAAVQHYERALQLDPRSADLRTNLARARALLPH